MVAVLGVGAIEDRLRAALAVARERANSLWRDRVSGVDLTRRGAESVALVVGSWQWQSGTAVLREGLDAALAMADIDALDDSGRSRVVAQSASGTYPIDLGVVAPTAGAHQRQRVNPSALARLAGEGTTVAVRGLEEPRGVIALLSALVEEVVGRPVTTTSYLHGRSPALLEPHLEHVVIALRGTVSVDGPGSAQLAARRATPGVARLTADGLGWSVEAAPQSGPAVTLVLSWPDGLVWSRLGNARSTGRGSHLLRVDLAPTSAPIDLDPFVQNVFAAAAPMALVDCLARWRPRPSCSSIALESVLNAVGEGQAIPDDLWFRVPAAGGVHCLLESARDRTMLALAGHAVSADVQACEVLARLLEGPAPWADLERLGPDSPEILRALLEAGVARIEPSDLDLRPPASPPVLTSSPPIARVSGAAPVVLGSARAQRLRPLDPGVEWERLLLDAHRAAVEASGAWLDDRLPGFGLPALLGRVRDPKPVWGHATSAFLAELDGPAAVDEIVASADLGHPHSYIAREGVPTNRPMPASAFLDRTFGGFSRRIDPPKLAALLRNGSTAILIGIDESVPRIARWMGHLERVGGRRCGINAYVSRGEAPGFGIHWDDHDVLVIQVAGAKDWVVHPPTERRAMRGITDDRVLQGPCWSGRLSTGDAVFVPRGWGHRITGLDVLSIHLTVHLRTASAAEVLRVGLGTAAARAARRDLGSEPPASPPPPAPDAAECVLSSQRANVPPRCHSSLWAALEPLGDATAVRLGAAGGLAVADLRTGNDRVIALGGLLLRLSPDHVPLLAALLFGVPVMGATLRTLASPGVADATVRTLAGAGLIELSSKGAE